MAKKLKQDYIEEAKERGAVTETDVEVIKDKYTRDELREIIQRDKKMQGEYFDPVKLCLQLNRYIDNTPIPIIKEFCYKNDISSSHFYRLCREYGKLEEAKKRAIDKKEANLEKGALYGKINTTMAIFSLKQLGWSDKHSVKHGPDQTLADLFKESLGE